MTREEQAQWQCSEGHPIYGLSWAEQPTRCPVCTKGHPCEGVVTATSNRIKTQRPVTRSEPTLTVAPKASTVVSKPIVTVNASMGGERQCRDCGVVLVPSGKRGRPAVKCDACKTK